MADKNPIGRVARIALDTWRRGSAKRPPTSTITRGNRGGAVKNKITHAQSNQSQKVGPTARHVPSNLLTRATEVIQASTLTSSRLRSGKLRLFLVLAGVFDSTKHSGATPIGSAGRAPYDFSFFFFFRNMDN